MTMTQEELNKIIGNHKHWLNEDCEGWENMRADLSDCDLRDCDLRDCDLSDCDLSDCYLSDSNLSNLKHDETTAFYDLQCPQEGDFIAFKKASGKIVKLRIPAEARRSSATTRKPLS